jgi:hypothetical protein
MWTQRRFSMPAKTATAKPVEVKAVKPKPEKAVKKPKLKTYTVHYSMSIDELIGVEVKALSREEAEEKAREKLMRDWEQYAPQPSVDDWVIHWDEYHMYEG